MLKYISSNNHYRLFFTFTVLILLITPKASSMERSSAPINALLLTFLAGAGLTLYYKLCVAKSTPAASNSSQIPEKPQLKYEQTYKHPLFTVAPHENMLAQTIIPNYYLQKKEYKNNICLKLDPAQNSNKEFSIMLSEEICQRSDLLKNMLSDNAYLVDKASNAKMLLLSEINQEELCCLSNLLILCDQFDCFIKDEKILTDERVKCEKAFDKYVKFVKVFYELCMKAFYESCKNLSLHEIRCIIHCYHKYELNNFSSLLAGMLALRLSSCDDLFILASDVQTFKLINDFFNTPNHRIELASTFFEFMPASYIKFTIQENLLPWLFPILALNSMKKTELTNPTIKLEVKYNPDHSLSIVSLGTQLKGHTAPVVYHVWNADGTRLLSVAKDGTARLWDWKNNKELAVIKNLDFPVSQSKKTLNSTIEIDWDKLKATHLDTFKNSLGKVGFNAIFSSNNKLVIALVNHSGKIEYTVLNAITGDHLFTKPVPTNEYAYDYYNRFLVCIDDKTIIYTHPVRKHYDPSPPCYELVQTKEKLTPAQVLYCLMVESLDEISKRGSGLTKLNLQQNDYLTAVHISLPDATKKNLVQVYEAQLNKIIKPYLINVTTS